MKDQWAEENLQVIRTLMERSAIYRRALAPIMIMAGTVGIVAAVMGWKMEMRGEMVWYNYVDYWLGPNSEWRGDLDWCNFVGYWVGVSFLVILCAFFMVRRQALLAEEKFWSPPTRRIFQAFLPAYLTGLILGVGFACFLELLRWMLGRHEIDPSSWFPNSLVLGIWFMLYGCGLHSAGFFMRRGIRLLGWLFILGGIGWLALLIVSFLGLPLEDYFGGFGEKKPLGMIWSKSAAYFAMGFFFGFLHLAYGIYLYFTEQKSNET